MASVTAGNVVRYGPATVSLSGAAAATVHTVTIAHPEGGVTVKTITTDSSGAGSVLFVPQHPGIHTITVTTVTTVASATVNGSGS